MFAAMYQVTGVNLEGFSKNIQICKNNKIDILFETQIQPPTCLVNIQNRYSLGKLLLVLYQGLKRSHNFQLNNIFSIINIISIAVTKNQEQAAVCFFFLAAGITVLVMISFHRLRQNEYFKQCQRQPFEMEVCSIRCSIWSGYTRLVNSFLG